MFCMPYLKKSKFLPFSKINECPYLAFCSRFLARFCCAVCHCCQTRTLSSKTSRSEPIRPTYSWTASTKTTVSASDCLSQRTATFSSVSVKCDKARDRAVDSSQEASIERPYECFFSGNIFKAKFSFLRCSSTLRIK